MKCRMTELGGRFSFVTNFVVRNKQCRLLTSIKQIFEEI